MPLALVAQASSRPGLLEVFFQAGPMAWTVALVLLGLSVASWSIMLGKYLQLQRAQSHTSTFLERFRNSQRFSEVAQEAKRLQASPLVGLFEAGYAEIDSQVKAARHPDERSPAASYRMKSLVSLERTLRRATGAELGRLARGTAFLATTAAASPFIGLFGTVWGIMVAFQDIGVSGSTSLVAVAPGIAEALINTALGLVAAIPALLGYNYYAARLKGVRTDLDDFTLEFMNLAERNFT
ncbi:MAG: MotA/TolQ/ExbB proton channel family protein [Thermoanaerobaculia bacterium]